MDKKRLEILLHLYFDEGLESETKHELEQMLLSSSQAREIFWEKASLNSALRQIGQESWGYDEALVERTKTHPAPARSSSFPRSWMLAASCLLAVGVAWWSLVVTRGGNEIATAPAISGSTQLKVDPSPQPAWVAMVRKTIEPEWAKGERHLNAGEAMPACRIRLERGLVEIQTSRGALLTLQGPADLEIMSDMEVLCRTGRLRVDVPPAAVGFLVNTPDIDVVDLGTSFAVDVDTGIETEVHVLEGKVELVSKSGNTPLRELVEGQAVGIAGGQYREIASSKTLVPSESQVNNKAKLANLRMRTAWERRSQAIAKDPSCFVYFDFEEDPQRALTLVNKAVGSKQGKNGTIVGCEWVEGRWPAKKALDFKSAFDRVLFEAPGEHTALTCMASIRLDSIHSSVLPLLMPAKSFDGAIRWQMIPTPADLQARLRFGRREPNGWDETHHHTSVPGFRREQLRTWVHLAVVWDGVNGVCSQYVDGVLLSHDRVRSQDSSDPLVVRTGKLEIGNSALDGFPGANHFTGRIDELAMFNRAFSDSEIGAFHDLKKVTWTNSGKDNDWSDSRNWSARIDPATSDAVYIDRSGVDAAVYAEGVSANLNEIRVGSITGAHGELRITGGTLTAKKFADANSRIGVAGGDGSVIQEGGDVTLNSLQLGLDEGSRGRYLLSGGTILIERAVRDVIGSIDIGAVGGVGAFDVKGGSLTTRRGVTLGREAGTGDFSVHGSRPAKISIGAYSTGDGFWVQHSGSTLRTLVDDQGLTPIMIHDVGDIEDGVCCVTFESNALLDVGFIGKPRNGAWDVMKWEGELIDNGLTFAPDVDTDIWQFEFVDTDSSGRPDTLRVTAIVLAQ